MIPVLVAGAIGFAIGACRHPLGRHLRTPALVLPGVAVGGAGLHVLAALDVPAGTRLFAISLALLSGFAVVNRHIFGMGILAVGLCCNFAAVLIHDGMPVRATALVASGAADIEDLADTDLGAGRRFERTADLAPILGDVIPVAPFRATMSFGDLIALTGIAVVGADLARYARRGSRWSLADAATGTVDRWRQGHPPPRTGPWTEGAGDDEDDVIDLDACARLSAGEWLTAQTLGEVGVDREQVRVLDVGADREVLDGSVDVVDAQDRVRS